MIVARETGLQFPALWGKLQFPALWGKAYSSLLYEAILLYEANPVC